MKYSLMPRMMWFFYKKTFKKYLIMDLGENPQIMKKAHLKYKEIVLSVDEFEKSDCFITNILSCAMLSAIILNLKNKHSVEEIRKYYRDAMCNNKMTKMATSKSKSYTIEGRKKLKAQAKMSETNSNPYSWRFEVVDGENINKYTAIFYTCGICYLMNKLGLNEYIPAMCSLDYDMASMNNTKFERKYTLASGGDCCDCHYDHQVK